MTALLIKSFRNLVARKRSLVMIKPPLCILSKEVTLMYLFKCALKTFIYLSIYLSVAFTVTRLCFCAMTGLCLRNQIGAERNVLTLGSWNATVEGLDSHLKEYIIFISTFLTWYNTAKSSATQHAVCLKFARKWGTECHYTRFPVPILLYTVYTVKLLFKKKPMYIKNIQIKNSTTSFYQYFFKQQQFKQQ